MLNLLVSRKAIGGILSRVKMVTMFKFIRSTGNRAPRENGMPNLEANQKIASFVFKRLNKVIISRKFH